MGHPRPFSPAVRRRQRDDVRAVLRSLVEAEERDKDEDEPAEFLTKADLERVEREFVCDMAHLQVFLDWYTMKGPYGGLTLTEVLAMPATMRQDFRYFMRVMSEQRRKVKREKKARDV